MGESTSKQKKPSYLRAFLTTTAVVGVINSAFFLYFLSLPEVEGKGGGSVMRRAIPDWFDPVLIMNIPGMLVVASCDWLGLRSPNQVASLLLMLVAGTLFWASIAVLIEFISARRKRRLALI